MKRLIHTPEGVRDVYNTECAEKQELKKLLMHTMHNYGYEEIETPTFEYFDVFSREIGTTPSKNLYKFFDKEGDTLVLRPDFTPSIARAVSMYFHADAEPVRLCYVGNTFQNTENYRGRLKEATEMGVEFIGDGSADADAEILAMAVDLLKASGLEEFQVSIGEVEFFKALLEDAQMKPETVKELRALISEKNYFGVEELICSLDLDEALKTAFLRMPQLFGGVEILKEAFALTENEKARRCIKRLERIYEILSVYGCEKYVSFDLGMLSKYNYYTGIIFQAFTYGTGEPIIKGGRYDNLQGYFGTPAPSMGFALLLENLLIALNRQKIAIPMEEEIMAIPYTEDNWEEAIRQAKLLRAGGKRAKLVREESKGL